MYTTLDQVQALIPGEFLTQSLDDNGDGVIDAWDSVSAAVDTRINGILGTRYAVPFSPVPPVVADAALMLACEMCYGRRGVSAKENPFAAQAEQTRKLLAEIAAGDMALFPGVNRQEPSVSIITEPSGVFSKRGAI